MELTVASVIDKRIVLRDKRAVLKRAFQDEDDKLKSLEDACEIWLLKKSQDMGCTTLSEKGVGTATQSTTTRVNCADWGVMHEWIKKTGNLDIFERRISRDFVKNYAAENGGAVPPALNIVTEITMKVTRAPASQTNGESNE